MKHAFTLVIDPVAKGRPRLGRGGRVYTPLRTVKFERAVRAGASSFKPKELMKGPIKLTLRFIFKPPMKWARDHHTTKPDCSNLAKGVEDALNGVFWVDDCQITHLRVEKLYDFKYRLPRIQVEITDEI